MLTLAVNPEDTTPPEAPTASADITDPTNGSVTVTSSAAKLTVK